MFNISPIIRDHNPIVRDGNFGRFLQVFSVVYFLHIVTLFRKCVVLKNNPVTLQQARACYNTV